MARQNRRDIFDAKEIGAFHCIQRVVRASWLCGVDQRTGVSYEHRKDWVQEKLQELAKAFSMDVLSFSVMSNHFHVVVRNRPDVVETWSDDEVARRWWTLFPRRRDKDGNAAEPTASELKINLHPKRLKELRRRLSDVSWFMRALAEPIARAANREDQCRGRFFEGRFKCQKLADETAILACSACVDLNPVRAGVAATPEESQYTSAYERIAAEQEARGVEPKGAKRGGLLSRTKRKAALRAQRERDKARSDGWLALVPFDERASAYRGAMPSANGQRASDKSFLAMSLEAYLQLLDWTGRQMRLDHKRGRIPDSVAPILQRLSISANTWGSHGFAKSRPIR